MAYINPNILQWDCDDLTGWTSEDSSGAVSSISPAGQLYLDCREMTGNGSAARYKLTIGIGSGNYYFEVKFKGDVWDGYGAVNGLDIGDAAELQSLGLKINNDATVEGIYVYDGAAWNRVDTTVWDNNWHTVVFYIHNSQTDCDIWIDKDPATEPADVTDADCSANAGDQVTVYGYGSIAGNGEYHIDYLYLGTGLAITEYTLTAEVGTFALTGIAAILIKGYTLIAEAGSFILTGIDTIFIKALNIVCSVGEIALTGIDAGFTKAINMAAVLGEFILTGIDTILSRTGIQWTNQAKSSSISPINITKNNISPINLIKNSINPTNLAKNSISPTNSEKTNSTFTNQDKS